MPPKRPAGAAKPQWAILQRKIFSRWCKQKLSRRPGIQVADIVTDLPKVFIDLLEVLSDSKFPGKKPKKPPTMRIQQIEYVSLALKWCWDLGVTMGVKPSAENVIDGNEKAIMALIWAIMMRFMKIGDDDDDQQLSAKDALLIWVQNKVAGYNGVEVIDFKKSFHDGLALCAIIHKHRPKLIDFESLDAADKMGNIQKAMDAATAYFQLEQYLKPDEVPKLDENSMVVYVSEYYYGIAEQKKIDLAARRIGKVINLTKENDGMRADYNSGAEGLRTRLNVVEKILGDRTIDNTMAGARARIEEFYKYKIEDKNVILGEQLSLEGLYNNLAMRLAHHKRPEFEPVNGLRELMKAIAHLEECEQERNVSLHAELNRQIKLAKLDEHHGSIFEKLSAWYKQKLEYVKMKEQISSVSEAQLQLALLDAFAGERQSVLDKSVVKINDVGKELLDNKFEFADRISERLVNVEGWFKELEEGITEKRPILEDDLARETFKEAVLLVVQRYLDVGSQLNAWIETKTAYLNVEEQIGSVNDAIVQLTLLDQFDQEKEKMLARVEEMSKLGSEILSMKYETMYSSYSYENPDEIEGQKTQIVTAFDETLVGLAATKREKLNAAKALEEEKERLRIEFAKKAVDFMRMCTESMDQLALTMFGFTLEEVEAFGAVIESEDAAFDETRQAGLSEAEGLQQQLEALSVMENPYTEFKMADLVAQGEAMSAAQETRKTAYEEELAVQRKNDELCKKFASLAEPFAAWINDQKEKISTSKEGLEEQLVYVVERESKKAEDASVMPEIEGVVAEMEEAGITNIRHTNLTGKDVQVQWEQYEKFLGKKKEMLEVEIEHHKLRGITPDQFKEIEENFKRFDADQSGSIDRKELTACLYSLGEERTAKEIKVIMGDFGDGTVIPYEGFTEFCIKLLGDTDTKEEVIDGFILICKGNTFMTKEMLAVVMEDPDIEFIFSTAPAEGEGFSYNAWVEEVFSR